MPISRNRVGELDSSFVFHRNCRGCHGNRSVSIAGRDAEKKEQITSSSSNVTISFPASCPPAGCNKPPSLSDPRLMTSKPMGEINPATTAVASASSPEMQTIRRPPLTAGPASNRDTHKVFSALTTLAPGAWSATITLETRPCKSSSSPGPMNWFVASIRIRSCHGDRPLSATRHPAL
jgi:hypothetical protein